jgi:hypothetical protein
LAVKVEVDNVAPNNGLAYLRDFAQALVEFGVLAAEQLRSSILTDNE